MVKTLGVRKHNFQEFITDHSNLQNTSQVLNRATFIYSSPFREEKLERHIVYKNLTGPGEDKAELATSCRFPKLVGQFLCNVSC